MNGRYVAGMDTKRLDEESSSDLDTQIGALLDRLNESASIVDRLMDDAAI